MKTALSKSASLITALTLSSALAAETPSPPRPMTIKQSVDIALSRNPDIMNFKERVNEAAQSKSQTIASAFPTINGSINATVTKPFVAGSTPLFNGEPYNQYNAQLNLNQPLYVGGAFWSGLSATDKEIDIRTNDLEVSERDLTFSIIQSFYTVLLNQQLLTHLKENKGVQTKSLETAERYYKIGRGQLIDVLQIKTQLALLEPSIIQAENAMTTAAKQLATLMHESQSTQIVVRGSLAPINPKSVEQGIKLKKPQLPEMAKAIQTVSQSQDKSTVQFAHNLPTLNAVGSIGRTAFARTDLLNDYSTTWSMGLQLTIPIFSGLSSHFERHVYESQTQQLELAKDKLADQLSFNSVQSEKDLDAARTVLESSDLAAKYADAALKQAQKDYSRQNINFLQLLTSEQNYLSSQSSYDQAKYNYIVAIGKYYVAEGVPISQLVEMLEQTTESAQKGNQ